MGEELGWRGYALPRLQTRRSALAASAILGTLWGLWHLPRLIANEQAPVIGALGWLLLGMIPWAIIYTWLSNGTGGSLLLPLLLHAATSVTGLFLASPAAAPLAIAPALTWAVAAAILRVEPRLAGRCAAHERAAARRAIPGRMVRTIAWVFAAALAVMALYLVGEIRLGSIAYFLIGLVLLAVGIGIGFRAWLAVIALSVVLVAACLC